MVNDAYPVVGGEVIVDLFGYAERGGAVYVFGGGWQVEQLLVVKSVSYGTLVCPSAYSAEEGEFEWARA